MLEKASYNKTKIVATVGPMALGLAALVGVTSMLGSLYFSEVAHFTPCKLCWYQRIAMYSAAIIVTVGAYRRDANIRLYAVVLAAIGGIISVYHILVERYPTLETSACDPTNPCSLIWVKRLGYVTIPTMALSGFAAMVALMGVHRRWSRAAQQAVSTP